MLCALQTRCRAAGVHACTVCQVILALQALIVTDARVEFTYDASSAELSFQVSESALCEPPDKPGRAAWSHEPVNASTATYTMYQARPMIPLQASVGQMQVS